MKSWLSIFLLILSIGFSSVKAIASFEIDGLALGDMPCEEAIKKAFQRSLGECDKYKEDKDTSGAAPGSAERKRSTKELCEDVVHMQEEVALESFKQFKPTTPLGTLCTRPTYQVDGRLLDAYQLTIENTVDFSEFRYKGCPFTKFFVTADQHPSDAPPNKLACDTKKVVFYSKEVAAPFEKIKKALFKKYGRPIRHWGHWKSSGSETNDTYQVNVEYLARGIHILLVNLANVDPADFDLLGVNRAAQRKNPTEERLEFRPQSVVFYFTESYIQTHRSNFKVLDDRRAQEEQKTKQEMEDKEKALLDQL